MTLEEKINKIIEEHNLSPLHMRSGGVVGGYKIREWSIKTLPWSCFYIDKRYVTPKQLMAFLKIDLLIYNAKKNNEIGLKELQIKGNYIDWLSLWLDAHDLQKWWVKRYTYTL